uniref:ZZ-type domain-containing protein n=1 Tax=Noctiluca scintillans TaxID=2966 RepID=A0A7S1A316_NOCSC|mmetsp:Transcript_29795/g.79211  ORF Transcript_29795/g.79211 Transcript_29795/m.79211 type:complete len:393 (+) Transcript_29795:72-1250(+)
MPCHFLGDCVCLSGLACLQMLVKRSWEGRRRDRPHRHDQLASTCASYTHHDQARTLPTYDPWQAYCDGITTTTTTQEVRSTATQCPKGHPLHKNISACGRFNCDLCGEWDLPTGIRLHSCRPCNWDVCEKCFVAAPTVMKLDSAQVLGPLSENLLPGLSVRLGDEFRYQMQVCSSWRALLDVEVHWEQVCAVQWPRVVPPFGESWRHFALRGGGYERGQKLSNILKELSNVATLCPRGHMLRRYRAELDVFSCDTCGADSLPIGTRLRCCRRCDWDMCERCFLASETLPVALAVGAQNYINDDGWSALHLASRLGFVLVAERLLESRADVNQSDVVNGFTPLMIGSTHDNLEVCQLLVAKGAIRESRNSYGRTALDCARTAANVELMALLSA